MTIFVCSNNFVIIVAWLSCMNNKATDIIVSQCAGHARYQSAIINHTLGVHPKDISTVLYV